MVKELPEVRRGPEKTCCCGCDGKNTPSTNCIPIYSVRKSRRNWNMLRGFCASAMGAGGEESPDILLNLGERSTQARRTGSEQQLHGRDILVFTQKQSQGFPAPAAHPVPFDGGLVEFCRGQGSHIHAPRRA